MNNILFLTESSQAAKYGGCFLASSTVQVSSGKRKKLSDLKVGEKVLSIDSSTQQLIYSEVLMFLDWDPQQRREFLKIQLKSGKTLTVTPSHLILTGTLNSTRTVYADRLKIGSKLLVSDSLNNLVEDSVVNLTPVMDTGVIAPLTSAGTVVVNDVVASCYAVVDSQSIAHWAFVPVRLYSNFVIGLERMWILMYKPITGWTTISKSIQTPNEGIHWYAKILYSIADYVISSHLHK